MSACQPTNMRGPWVKTPLLLLLLLTALTGTVLCQDDSETQEDNAGDSGDMEAAEVLLFAPNTTLAPDASTTSVTVDENIEGDHGSRPRHNSAENTDVSETTEYPSLKGPTTIIVNEEEDLDLIIILIPVVLVVVVIGMIVCGIFISQRWNKKTNSKELRKDDPYLDGSSTEKVPMPMFEEDVPSVLELEMEELDQWMKKDGETAEDSKQS